MKVLIAEDSQSIQQIIIKTLAYTQFEFITANNGEEAYIKFHRENPDLVITDLNMPLFNGLDFIKRIKQDEGIDVPMIVISSITDPKYVIQAIRLGADDYLMKPFDGRRLKLRVNRLVQQTASKRNSVDKIPVQIIR